MGGLGIVVARVFILDEVAMLCYVNALNRNNFPEE
jgi:hypothetical protein